MTRKHQKGKSLEECREFIVKTHHVWVVAVLLLVLCVTFFWLGRWYERKVSQYYPGVRVEPKETPSHLESDLSIDPEDMEQRVTFFDRLESNSSQPISSKQDVKASPKKDPGDQKQTAPKEVSTKVEPKGSFYTIQVLAGNQRSKALKDSETLEKMGFSSYVQEEQRTSGTLYKVRVGKYSSKEKASQVEARLKKKGYQTWILKVD